MFSFFLIEICVPCESPYGVNRRQCRRELQLAVALWLFLIIPQRRCVVADKQGAYIDVRDQGGTDYDDEMRCNCVGKMEQDASSSRSDEGAYK